MKNSKARDITRISLFVALISVCSQIMLPIFSIPVTLSNLAVFVACAVLGLKKGIFTIFVYIFAGALGLPVFAGFKGGISAITGPTGGFILSFLLCPLIISGAIRLFGRKTPVLYTSMTASLICCYLAGSLHYYFFYSGGGSLLSVLSVCVFPFIIPDILKIIASVLISSALSKVL